MERLTEYELFIINRIAVRNRWCKKHISREDVLQGRNRGELDLYADALDNLVKKGIVQMYKSGGREDYCLPKTLIHEIKKVLNENVGKYNFLDEFLIKRIK
jgi:hypothetical protein